MQPFVSKIVNGKAIGTTNICEHDFRYSHQESPAVSSNIEIYDVLVCRKCGEIIRRNQKV